MKDAAKKRAELPKAYEAQAVEDGIYGRWEASGLFDPDKLPPLPGGAKRTEPFTIMMPPPNATGTLHIGHAMFMTLQDVLTRFHRLRGKLALWVPGTDHAALATNAKVERILAKEGKTRRDLGQEAFVARVNEYIAGSQGTIRKQIRKMGSSCDWSREAYTFDAQRSKVVREVFVRMYDDGLIYRGVRIVNWCPGCGSAVADDEVKHVERQAKLYYMKYGPFVVATTRPETKLGDTAVAVHPDDARYKDWHGKTFQEDFGSGPLTIRVITDAGVDPAFGSGVVGVTPAHSMVDYQMAQRNDLPLIQVIGEDGRMTPRAGKYAGMPVLEARAAMVADLEAAGRIEKVEDIMNSLSICDRSDDPIEPLTSKQWFVAVNKEVPGRGKTLKEMSVEAVESGRIGIVPERFEKVYFNWMQNLHDWCISRQIWFGHRIPVWYCRTCQSNDPENGVNVRAEAPSMCGHCGGTDLWQDPDSLDTWFSSGTWTFSALGWPDNVEDPDGDFRRFHPTQLLETGYDIIFFWVARMILMTTYAVGDIPFEKAYLHGLVRDEQGRKMSKSLENIIDPLDVAAKYGTDAVRLSLTIGNAPGNDLRMSEDKIEHFRNFANKLWNIARFVQMTVGALEKPAARPEPKTVADRWILNRLDAVTRSVTDDLVNLNLSRPGETLRDFTWGELADWYLEIAKIEGDKQPMLSYLLHTVLVLWHPFMPFVTEELYGRLFAEHDDDFLMVAAWPEVAAGEPAFHDGFDVLREVVTAIRNIRSEYRVEPGKRVDAMLASAEHAAVLRDNAEVIKGLAKVGGLTVSDAAGTATDGAASAVVAGVQITVPLAGLVDAVQEKARLDKEIAEVGKYVRALEGKLGNAEFASRAPEHVVEAEREKLRVHAEKLTKLTEQRAALG